MSDCRGVKLTRISEQFQDYLGYCPGCRKHTFKVDGRDHRYKCASKDCRYNKPDHLRGVSWLGEDKQKCIGYVEVRYE